MKTLGKKIAKGGIHPSVSCTHLSRGAKQVICFYTLWWSLLLVLKLQPIIHDNMSTICWVVNAHFQFVLNRLKKLRLKEKICCHWTLWYCCPCCEKSYCYCSTLGHIPQVLILFFFLFVYFLAELWSIPILWYSSQVLCVFTCPQWKQFSNLIEHQNPLKKSLFTVANWITCTTEYVCTWLQCGKL